MWSKCGADLKLINATNCYTADCVYQLSGLFDRKPPVRLNFGKALIEPFNNDYDISWFNGSIQHLISFDRPMSANSMNLDYVFGFEAKYLDYNKIKDEVLPNKNVICFYYSTEVTNTPTGHDSFTDTVITQLVKRGWNVTPIYFGQPLKHNLKHHYFDLAFKGDPRYLFPTFNQDNKEYLVLALESTGIVIGKTGF